MAGNWTFTNKMALEIDKPNLLDQVYPLNIVEEAVAEAQIRASEGELVGELNHPHAANVDLERAVVKYSKIWIDYNDMTVRVNGELLLPNPGELLTHPTRVVLHLQNRGVKFGISHRSFTCFENNEEKTGTCEYMQIIALDVVYGPAFPNSLTFTENSVFQCKCKGSCANGGECKELKKYYNAYNNANSLLGSLLDVAPHWHRKAVPGIVYGWHPAYSNNRDLFDDLVNEHLGGDDVIIEFDEDTDDSHFIFADCE